MNLLLCVTGSVATIKIYDLVSKFESQLGHIKIRIVTTENGRHFFDAGHESLKKCEIFTNQDEWSSWSKRGDPVKHIELRNWADIILIAPLCANTLAKIAQGMCDNLLTCIIRACQPGNKPVLFCPAMNTQMYEHPLTRDHLNTLTETLKFTMVPTISKTLICGEVGDGNMADVDTIVTAVQNVVDRLK